MWQQSLNREEWIDWLKGFGILLMIISHSGLASSLKIDIFINSFYMPMFFLISGYFLHIKKYTIGEYVKKKIKGLLVPYLIWGTFHFVVWMAMYLFKIIELSETPQTMIIGLVWNNNVHLPIAGALWFICCLFIISCLAFVIIKRFGPMVYFVLSAIFGAIGLFLHPFLPWSADTALVANLFFAVGYYMSLLKRKWSKVKVNIWIEIVITILVMALFHIGAYYNGFSNIRECNYGKFPIAFAVIALMGIASWWLIANLIYRNVCLHIIKSPIAWVGKHSMPFLCLNQLVLSFATRLLPYSVIGQIIASLLALTSICVLTLCILRIERSRNVQVYSLLFGR